MKNTLTVLILLTILQLSGQTTLNNNKFIVDDNGVLTQYGNYVVQTHRIADYNTTTTNWDTLKLDTIIACETVGAWSLGTDSTYVIPPDTGIYNFCGCWHIKNSGGANVTAEFLSYITNGAGDTAMCSQISETINKDAGEYITIHFCGSVAAGNGCKVRANFKVGDTDLDLTLNPNLPKAVAASFKMTKVSN